VPTRRLSPRRAPLARVVALLLVAGCSTTSLAAPPGPGENAGGAATTVPTTTSTPPRGVSVVTPPGPVTFAFAGDVHFEGVIRSALDADPATVMADIAPSLSAADVAVVNLETAITERGTPEDKEYTFRAPATAIDALRAAGVDVASMANNHGVDFGPEGLEDSLTARDASGFPLIGIGRNAAEAYAPYRTTVNGQRIAVIAATDVLDGHLIPSWTATDAQPGLASAKDVDRLVAAVAAARPDTDTLVVFLHWGTEGTTCPNASQPALAQRLVDAGADIVVGSHAHRVLGAGRQGTALVAYGLGNFTFYSSGGPATETGVLHVTATGRQIDDYSWEPAVIRAGRPRPLTGEEADAARSAWTALRDCTDLTP